MTSSPSEHSATGILSARPIEGNCRQPVAARPTRSEAEAAVRTLIAWLGDDPDRTDLQGTPARVATAFHDSFTGYRADPVVLLRQSLMATEAAGQLVLLRAIRFVSFCEHHLLPFTGYADVGYVPRRNVVGLGSMAAAVDAVARRLQIRERVTDELAAAIAEALDRWASPSWCRQSTNAWPLEVPARRENPLSPARTPALIDAGAAPAIAAGECPKHEGQVTRSHRQPCSDHLARWRRASRAGVGQERRHHRRRPLGQTSRARPDAA
jgi:GTP cyclohydrolase IA